MIHYKILAKKDIHRIKPLWEQLNDLHQQDSVHFKDHFSTFTFEKRVKAFEHIIEDNLHIIVALDDSKEEGKMVGYCLSTIKDTIGEIDSIYLDSGYRGQGIGEKLAKTAFTWIQNKNPSRILVAVSFGHDEVIPFYQKLGFYPRYTALEFKVKAAEEEIYDERN